MASPSTTVELTPAQRWLMSALLLAGIGIALWGFNPVLEGSAWWLQGVIIATLVLAGAAGARSVARHRVWAPVAGAAVGLVAMTFMFVAPTAILGIIPTWDSFLAFRALDLAGNRDIASQSIPAEATEGIRFLICLGVAVIALLMDTLAQVFRAPALAGVPLLTLLLVPSFVRAEFVDGFIFAFAAVTWLAALVVNSRPAATQTAVGVGAAAVVAALVIPLALPGVEPPPTSQGPGNGFAAGLNPIITLGDDLRRGNPTLALTYRTSDDEGQYLRMTVLDDFSGESWEQTVLPDQGDVEQMGPPIGVGEGVPRTNLTTNVEVANVLSRWLPVPYAAESIRGLEGVWSWEFDGLTVRSERANAQNQDYEVDSVQPAPSVEQLVASGSGPFVGLDPYLALPAELPESVRQTAIDVTAASTSNYERALALQDFFRGGQFTYSEDAPVEQDFDGSGAEVLGPFLEVRSGYCVHFSSAMAAMARVLGIPARVVVGFTPGTAFQTGDNDEIKAYRVTTHNLHAWPELYFEGIGWVRFEPTPGRGAPPAFAPLDEDDPATPDVDESVPPPPAPDPSLAPETTPEPNLPDEEVDAGRDDVLSPDAATGGIPIGGVIAALVALLLITPAVIRAARRGRRVAAVGRGSALDGWDELRDTAYDLGLASDITLTPRQLADDLAPHLDDDGAAALARLRGTLESQAFARESAQPSTRDLRDVLSALRRDAGLPRALAATLLPRSLVRDWLPSVVGR